MKDINRLECSIKDAYDLAMTFGLDKESTHTKRAYHNCLKQIAINATDSVFSIMNKELFSLKGNISDINVDIDDIK